MLAASGINTLTPPSFPSLAGQGWSVHKKPLFSTRVASHASGREARTPFFSYPLYEFELTFDALDSGSRYPGLGSYGLQSLMGLFLSVQGQFGTFLYTDPTDNAVISQTIASGDGTTTAFPFVRTLGGFTEPVGWVTGVNNVYLNGVVQKSGFSLNTPNTLAFLTAPGAGTVIAADFRAGSACLNTFLRMISGASAGFRLPRSATAG
jgi:hypothetical protein